MSDHIFHEEEFRGQLDWPLWKRVMRHARPYRGTLVELGVHGLLVAVFDMGFPLITARLIDESMAHGLTSALTRYGALYGVLILGLCACIWRFIILAGRIATGLGHDIRSECFAKLQDLPFSYFDRRPVGWLMARLTSDCSRLSNLVGWLILDLVWGSCLICGISAIMLILNWKLALIVLVTIPPLVWISLLFQKRLLLTSRAMRKANSQLTAGFNEAMMGVRTTKTLVREAQNLDEFQMLSGEMYRHSMRNALYSAAYLPIILTMSSAGVGLALWGGGASATALGISLGTLIAFMQYAALFFHPIEELARRFTDLQVAQASAERIQGLLDEPLEIEDSAEVKAAIARHLHNPLPPGEGRSPQATRRGEVRELSLAESIQSALKPGVGAPSPRPSPSGRGREVIAIDGHAARIETIEFRNVSFAYKQGQRVLDDFNFVIEAGQTIALVGPTGGGKSTIVSLLCRFYEPTSGEILINGLDYRRRSLRWLQSCLGIVLQQPHLFSGTIRENIRYGRLDANEEEIIRAAALVNAHPFIERMEKQYESEVGEGGNRLSTGQKQLIALARAVLADPQIFVMDEATSSVDTHTEQLIQDGIEKVLSGRTSFVIAHRLSTIRNADRILVIDGGRIVEQGDHRGLIGQRGRYHELYTNQFTHDREDELLAASPK